MNLKKVEPKKPRFQPGEQINELTVLKIVGHKENGLTKKQWWYQVECSCGTVEIVNQSQLLVRLDCRNCANDRRSVSEHISKSKTSRLPRHLDFARIKF